MVTKIFLKKNYLFSKPAKGSLIQFMSIDGAFTYSQVPKTADLTSRMKWVLVYKGMGMYQQDTDIWTRVMKLYVDTTVYQVDTVSPEDIVKGRLAKDAALLAIGGGYDLGLIEALGACGMKNIRDFVMAGGSYLGICSGAYFACDRIEFDKSGPQEVVGERFLKFYPGVGIGPLFKTYDYKSRLGAEAVTIDYHCVEEIGDQSCQTKYPEASNQQLCQNSTEKQSNPCTGRNVDKIRQGSMSLCVLERETVSTKQKNCVRIKTDTLVRYEFQGEEDIESQTPQMESPRQKESPKQTLYTEELSQRSRLNKESQSKMSSKGCKYTVTAENDLKKHHDLQTCHKNLEDGIWKDFDSNNIFSCKGYFNGGCYFNGGGRDDGVTILSHYLDLLDSPAAIVRCSVGAGVAILSGLHLEYEASDIDDGDTSVTDIIPCLRNSARQRQLMIKSLLEQLSIKVK